MVKTAHPGLSLISKNSHSTGEINPSPSQQDDLGNATDEGMGKKDIKGNQG